MKFYDYRLGPEPVAAMGAMRPLGTRVLCRAILDSDWYNGALKLITYNAIDAVAFEVVSVGAGVKGLCEKMGEVPPTPGQHCDIRSVAADRVYSRDVTGRFWLVPVDDIAAVWDPVPADAPGLAEACAAVQLRSQDHSVVADAKGLVDLAPVDLG